MENQYTISESMFGILGFHCYLPRTQKCTVRSRRGCIHRIPHPVSSSLLIARLNADMISTFPSRSALVPFRISLSCQHFCFDSRNRATYILQRSRHPIPDRERIDFMLDSKMLINGCCHLPEHRLPHADRQAVQQ